MLSLGKGQRSHSVEKSKRLLIIDESKVIRDVMCNMLTIQGFDVDAAEDGFIALRLLDENAYDVVLVDMMMPVMTGNELYCQIEEKYPDVTGKVIFLIDDDTPDFQIRPLFTGINRPVLSKSFIINGLINKSDK